MATNGHCNFVFNIYLFCEKNLANCPCLKTFIRAKLKVVLISCLYAIKPHEYLAICSYQSSRILPFMISVLIEMFRMVSAIKSFAKHYNNNTIQNVNAVLSLNVVEREGERDRERTRCGLCSYSMQ